MSDAIVELRAVRADYGGIEVLHGVDLAIPAGSVFALLGPNGAGKTTTLNVIAGLHPCGAGDVLVGARRVNGARAESLARCGLCLVPEGRGVFPNLSVRENLRMATHTGRRVADVEAIAYAHFPKLSDRRGQLAGTLSGGEQQMLAMARGLASDPAVLMLDELSMGLAPLVVGRLYEQVAEIARQGVAVLVVEQFAAAVLGIADHAAVLVRGRVERQGRPDDALRAELSALYLGSSR